MTDTIEETDALILEKLDLEVALAQSRMAELQARIDLAKERLIIKYKIDVQAKESIDLSRRLVIRSAKPELETTTSRTRK